MIQLSFLFLLIGISHCYGQGGIGKTYIEGDGANGNLTFNVNDVQTIDVRIEVVDAANPTATIDGNVAVTCEIVTQNGYTSATFNTITLNEATKTGSITPGNVGAGRGAEVKCYGVSATGTQFTKEASISSVLVLTITSSPKVSICTTGDIVIKNVLTPQTFPVALSDVVLVSSVTVTCTVAAGGTTAITLTPATVPVGSNTVAVSYSLTTAGTPINVTCNGQSATGSQYTTATSQGSPVQFTVNRPKLDLYPKQFTTSASAFSLILILTSPPPNASLPLTCTASSVSTAAEVTAGLTSPSCSNPNPTAEPDFSVGVGQLEPTAGTLHTRVNVTRNLLISSSISVIVSCCSTDQSLSDAILVVMEPSTNKSIDYSKATEPGSVNTEREYKNPAYVDVSPCPCDITTTLCDIGCCCDQDCTATLKSAFTSCIPGLSGGQSAALPEYDCRSDHFNKDDWFPLMCVEREFNALLGYFYPNTLAVRNDQAFNEKIATVTGKTYSYKEEGTVTTSTPGSYTGGKEVRTYQESYRAGEYARSGPVVLPQRILSGECLPESPVEYLKDFTASCVYELTENQCSVRSSFNPLFYVEASNTRDPACPKPYIVMKDSTQEVAETYVDYHCVTDYSSYVKSTTPQNLVTPNTSYTFNYTLPVSDCQDLCGNEVSSCTDYNTISDSPQGEVLPPRCSWDDGYTRPPLVAVNGNNCENSVLEVRYKIYWTGSQIVKLNATVIMGNVALSTNNAPVITQKFSSEFLPSFTGNPLSTLDNYQGVETSFSRSGKPGYDYEKPLFSGSLMNVAGNNYVNQNISRQLAVWDTGVDGLCDNAGRKTIMFGQDTFAACMIYLRSSQLSGDCTDLRKLIINRLNFLLAPADKIGRYGINNPWDLNHWIDIKRENLDNLCIRNINHTSEYLLSLTTSGLCTDMISGISLNIFYAETGKANYYPINEIIGANITYVNSTWRMKCYTSGGSACGSNDVEPFRLTMNVHFIKSTPNRPARPDKYYAERSTTCQLDVCWRNLIYPLSRSYNYESREYVLGMVLISIIGIVAYTFVTWPWW